MDLKQLLSPSNFKSIMTKAQTIHILNQCGFQLTQLVESLVIKFDVWF